jgi:exopolysaccharide production protein ExoF
LLLVICIILPVVLFNPTIVASVPQARIVADAFWRLGSWISPRAGPAGVGVTRIEPKRASAPTLLSAVPKTSSAWLPGVIADGDRLKITFYESLGVAVDQGGVASGSGVTAVFPRMDLSSEYTVDETGTLDIPRLGHVTGSGRSLSALQTELAAEFRRVFGRTSDVHAEIVERQPIYVLGGVRNAGSLKYAPGMIVLQALALAGGMEPGVADLSRAIEAIRETERLRQATDRLDRLLVRQARLQAHLGRSNDIMVPDSIRSRLAGKMPQEGLAALLAGETATLIAEREAYQQQLALAQRQVNIARIEIEVQKTRSDQLKVVSARKTERLRELEQVAARGSVSQFKLSEVSLDISELGLRQEDLRVAMAQGERRLVEAEIVQAKLELEYSVGLRKELTTTMQDIAACKQEIASMQAVTQVLRNGLPDTAGGSDKPAAIRITRRGPDGFKVVQATAMTLLVPGDTVQVSSGERTDTSTAGETEQLPRLTQ